MLLYVPYAFRQAAKSDGGVRQRPRGIKELRIQFHVVQHRRHAPTSVSQIICFQVPGGATLGPVHKCLQFHNLGIEPLWFEIGVLALPPAKALP